MTGAASSAHMNRVDALERRVERMRAFGSLRRSLRVAEEPAEIAAAAVRFAVDVLGCLHCVIYCGDKDASDFELLSDAPATLEVPATVGRGSALVAQLEGAPTASALDLLTAGALPEATQAVALALRASPTELIGLAVVVGTTLDSELLDELAFDLESALSSRMIARLRTEELAVLEIQERELVGLLHDVEARDAIIRRDLEDARRFQNQMLGVPPRVAGASIEVVYQPIGLIGGDLYAISVEGERLRLFVADATGHGIRASLTTMFIKSGYESVRRTASHPAALLAALNDTIARTYRSAELLFTAVCADLDLATGRVISAAGGHPEVCVVHRGEASLIASSGPMLGLKADLDFANHELSLERGDGVYLYTDGFIEARANGRLFGDDRFKSAIVDAHNAGAPAGEAVVAAVTSFLAGTPLADDGTFIGVRLG